MPVRFLCKPGDIKQMLPEDYEIRELNDAEFDPLWQAHAPQIFDENAQIFRVWQWLDDSERAKAALLKERLGKPYALNLGLFYKSEFVGWCAGHQESSETYYMRNSAVLPEHRRKGLYTQLLEQALSLATQQGFQKIYSRHSATNNDVIIPKLRVGFTISSLEVSDTFGVLVHLTYFPKSLRRKVMLYRVGEAKPDDEIKNCLGLERNDSEE